MAFSTLEWIILLALFLFSFIGSGVWAFIKIRNIRWNYNYVVWETVNGADKQEPTKKGKCRLITVGDSGEEIFYLQKLKKYKVAYGKRVGKNTIYWTIGNDGLWYNTEVGNFNNNFKSLGLMPVDRDIRYASVSVRKLLDRKYNKIDQATKTYMIVTFILLLIGIGISVAGNWLVMSKYSEGKKLDLETSKIQNENAKLLGENLNKLNTVKQGGTGYEVIPTP